MSFTGPTKSTKQGSHVETIRYAELGRDPTKSGEKVMVNKQFIRINERVQQNLHTVSHCSTHTQQRRFSNHAGFRWRNYTFIQLEEEGHVTFLEDVVIKICFIQPTSDENASRYCVLNNVNKIISNAKTQLCELIRHFLNVRAAFWKLEESWTCAVYVWWSKKHFPFLF